MNTPSVADLAKRRWHYVSFMYLLDWGEFKQAEWEANIDYAARLGFNAIRFNFWWPDIVPDAAALQRGGNWHALDHIVNYAISRGLKVVLTVCLRPSFTNYTLFCAEEDRVQDRDRNIEQNWDGTTRISYSSPRFGHAIRFFQQVCERYIEQHNAGHILAISPLITKEAEIAYACGEMEDYSPHFLAEFRAWAIARHGSLAAANTAWETAFATVNDIVPEGPMSRPQGMDWFLFRELKAKQFVDSCCAVAAGVQGAVTPLRLMLDYGNCGDPAFLQRDAIGFTLHGDNPMIWAIKHNDDHFFNQAYTGSWLGSNTARLGKLAFNEWFYHKEAKYYPHGDVVGDSVNEIRGHFEQGMNGVSYVGAFANNAPVIDTIVHRLQDEGVWDGPIVPRTTDPARTVHVKLSETIPLWGWMLKEKYFDPHWDPAHPQLNMILERDLEAPLLPVVPPL